MSFMHFNKRCLHRNCGKIYHYKKDGCPYCKYKGFTIRDCKHDTPEIPLDSLTTALNILAEQDDLITYQVTNEESRKMLDFSMTTADELWNIVNTQRFINPDNDKPLA